MARRMVGGAAMALLAMCWCAMAWGQCGGGGGNAAEKKKIMNMMKDVTVALVEIDQKLGEKNPDDKEAKQIQANARKLAVLTKQFFPMVCPDATCKTAIQKLAKGVGDLMKNSKTKKSIEIHDGISQIRATCSECHMCKGL